MPVIPPPRFFFITCASLCVFFAAWTWLVFAGYLPPFDLRCAEYWHDSVKTTSGSRDVMFFITDLGGIATMTMLTIMGAIWQTGINHRFLAVAWMGVMIGGAFLNQGLKAAFDRERPPVEIRDRAVIETNESYPSGHSMTSAIGYGMLAYALVLPQRRRPRRLATMILLTGIVIAVGFSRIYVRAHWFSDVIAGWTLGLAWVFFCVALLERRRLRIAQRT